MIGQIVVLTAATYRVQKVQGRDNEIVLVKLYVTYKAVQMTVLKIQASIVMTVVFVNKRDNLTIC